MVPPGEGGFRGRGGAGRSIAIADVSRHCEIDALPDAGHACGCFGFTVDVWVPAAGQDKDRGKQNDSARCHSSN